MSAREGLIAHRLVGEGETVAFLNGGMMTHASWEAVATAFEGAYRSLFADFRGQLLTPGPSHESLDGHVDDVVALLDALGIERVQLVGTSFGGAVGLRLAARHPLRVQTLCAITTSDVATPVMRRGVGDLRRIVAEVVDGGSRAPYAARLVSEVYSEAYRAEHAAELALLARQIDALPMVWFEGLLGILRTVETLDLREDLARIGCPTLVVHAAQDALMGRERSRALAGGIAGAEYVEHPASGHALVAEDPAWLAARCRAFIDRHAGRTTPPRGETRS